MTEHFDTASPLSAAPKHPLKVFLYHAHSDKDAVKALYTRLATLAPGAHLPWWAVPGSAGEDSVDA